MWHEKNKGETMPPATQGEIDTFVDTVFAPLSIEEIDELNEEHEKIVGTGHFDPPFDPSKWRLPNVPLPQSYLDFLSYSNGGFFEGENRDFDPLFSVHEVRDYMLSYSIPHWMPGVCPVAFDGGGTFYLIDMRESTKTNEYPILFAHAGNLTFEDASLIADSFKALIDSRLE